MADITYCIRGNNRVTRIKENTLEYVSQPDPDRNLCLRCKEIFVNRMQRYGL